MNEKKNILVVFGTRPEVIKLAPVIIELRKHSEYNVIVCNTEQQKELSNQTLEYFGLKADINLDCMRPNQPLAEIQSRILLNLDKVFRKNRITQIHFFYVIVCLIMSYLLVNFFMDLYNTIVLL